MLPMIRALAALLKREIFWDYFLKQKQKPLTWFLLHLQAVIVLAMVVMTAGFDFDAGRA